MSKVKLHDRIREVFTSPLGHILTIVGVSEEKCGRSTKHLVECSNCSLDKELFPEPFKILYNKLLNGQSPCGCNKYTYSERQVRLMIERKCATLGHRFLGFRGKFINMRTTEPIIDCGHDNDLRMSCHHYINYVKHGCNMCVAINTRKDIVEKAKPYLDVTDVVITEPDNLSTFIYYRCKTCSDDWFVKNNYCDGWFKIRPTRLKSGNLTCRCSEKFIGGDKYKIGKAVLGQECNPATTVLSTYRDARGNPRFNIHCSIHGNTTQDDYTCYTGYLPKCCGQAGWYTRKGQETEVDFLYIIRLVDYEESFIKIGRSFDVPTRMDQLEDLYHTELLYVLTSKYEEICKYERLYHKVFRPYRVCPSISFKGESEVFSEELLNLQDFKLLIVDLVNGY